MNKFSSFKEYISDIDYDLFLEMAAHSGIKEAGTPSHLHNEDTWHYLHQFHPKHHTKALKFLFGKGMHDASKARHAAIEKNLEEKYPNLSEEDRWMEFYNDPHNPIEAMDSASAKHKEEGIVMKAEKGETYYHIPELMGIVEQKKDSLVKKGWGPKELGIMLKGYFHESHLNDLNQTDSPLKGVFKQEWITEKRQVQSKKTRRYHVDTKLQKLAKQLEGHDFDKDEFKNAKLDPDTWHADHSQPDHDGNTTNVDYGHPNSPDLENMVGDEESQYHYGAAGGVSEESLEDALHVNHRATALGVLGGHKETWTDRHGVEHQTELRQVKHGDKDLLHNATWTIECVCTMWDSDEERIGAFEELHKELEKLEEDTSNEHNYFPWKVIQPFINESSGSSITIETNTATPKNISSWINGTLKWSSDGSTLERGTGGSYHEKFVGKKAKYKVVHSTGSGALHIPHIKNEIKYKEVETVGDVEISSEEKKEEVHQPVPNNGGYILPFEKCLSTGELYELKILKPKDHGSDNPQSIQLMPNDKLQLPKLPQGHLRVKTLDGDKCKKAHPEKTHEEWLKSGVKGEKDSLGEMPKNIHKIKDKKTNEWRVLVKNDVKRIGHPDESSGNKNIFSHWNKLSDKQKKCMTLFTNTHLNLMRHNEDFAKLTGHKAYDPGSLTALGGHTLGTNNTQAHHPLHKYHKLQNFMNNEYEALNDLALNGGEEVLVKVSRIKEAFDTDQDERDQGNIKRIVTDPAILDDVKGRHAGQVWKEAVDSIYSYIRDSKHVSEIMKSAMMASLESISMLAVFRVVENLGHEKIGLGFERVVEDGKVKFTYDENKDPNKEGVKARKNETQRFMNSYSQADHGTGPRRGRVNVDTLNKGGESDEERDTDAASDDLKRRTDARIEQVGGKYKAKAVKSDWFKDGCSVRDLIRGQRGKTGGDCRAANQTWAANVEVIENKLNFELAKWANEVSLPTGSSVPDDVVDKLSKEILNDEDWLKANIKGGIDPAKISAELERFKEDPALADKSIDVSGIKEVPKDPDDVINNAWDLISKSQEMDQTTIQQLKSNPQLMKSMIKRFDDAKFDLNNIDAAASGRISRDKEEMLKDLKNSWNKIFGADEPKATDVPVAPKTMTTKSVTSTDDEHDQLDKLEKEVQELYGHPVAIRKIFMDNLELHYKGGIQEFLKSFDQAATNSAFLKHRLVLIRSKLKELSGDEAAPGAKPTFGSDVKDGLNEL